MSSAIEVLKKERLLCVEKIRDIRKGNKTRASDIVKIYQKIIDIYQEFIEALSEALLALEQKEKLVDLFLELANRKEDDFVTGNEIIDVLLKANIEIEQGEGFQWNKIGGVKSE